MKFRKYLLNCFLLLIPILLWNIVLFDYLPKPYGADVFWNDIPNWIRYGENILRIFVFGVPLIMTLSIKSRNQKIGLLVYLFGILTYFLSWVAVIIYSDSAWSNSIYGFTAPAYTTIIWFLGIGLIGEKSLFRIPKLFNIYLSLSVLFVILHTIHACVVFQRL